MSGGHHETSSIAFYEEMKEAAAPATGFLTMIMLLPVLAVPFVGDMVLQHYHGTAGGGGGHH